MNSYTEYGTVLVPINTPLLVRYMNSSSESRFEKNESELLSFGYLLGGLFATFFSTERLYSNLKTQPKPPSGSTSKAKQFERVKRVKRVPNPFRLP